MECVRVAGDENIFRSARGRFGRGTPLLIAGEILSGCGVRNRHESDDDQRCQRLRIEHKRSGPGLRP
jgi:hypothetical protein